MILLTRHAMLRLFMPPPLGTWGIMFSGCPTSGRPSVCPSVSPNPENPSFHLYMGPLVHSTNRDRFSECPSVHLSVRPDRFPGISRRTHGGKMAWNFAPWCILTTFRTNQIMVMVCVFFLFWCYFDLVKRVKFAVSEHFLENAWREWPEIVHAGVSWPPSELISSWSWSVDFRPFGVTLTYWNRSNLGFPGISRGMHGGNGLKFYALKYPDHFHNCLGFGHALLIFLIIVPLWLGETSHILGLWASSGKRLGINVECMGSGGIFQTLCVEFCLVYNVWNVLQ